MKSEKLTEYFVKYMNCVASYCNAKAQEPLYIKNNLIHKTWEFQNELIQFEKEISDESITDTSNPDPIYPPAPLQGAGYDGMGYEEAREIVKENIEYDILVQDPRQDREQLDEVVELIAETLCSRKKTIVIAGDEYPAEMVKEKLLRITASHIEYVFDCLKQNTTYVRNIKKYLLASLFNAPSTMGSYYSALVNHDMYGDGLRGKG